MIDRILEITRVPAIERYGKNNQQSGQNSRKKEDLDFANILASKMNQGAKNVDTSAYKLDLNSLEHF